MKLTKYRAELTELTEIWNCDERTAILHFLHVINIMRGYSPRKVAAFTNHLSDDWLAYCFVEFMEDRFRMRPQPIEIDLLSIKPTEG